MGKPLVVGNRHERYSRVKDKQLFDKNMDRIKGFGKPDPKSGRRTRIRYANGQRIVEHLDEPEAGAHVTNAPMGPTIIIK